jgi:predicted  nucleic acid-binding Zn-ribbon protein
MIAATQLCGGGLLIGSAAATATQPSDSPSSEQRLQTQAQEAKNHFLKVQNSFRNQTHRVVVSRAVLLQAAAALDNQLQSLELELVSAKARMDAITMQIDVIGIKADKAAREDPALVELEKVVAAREQIFKRDQDTRKARLTSVEELNLTEIAVAEARAQAALQRERVVAAKGGDAARALNKELIDLQIAEHDDEEKLEFLRDRLHGLAASIDRLDTLEDAQAELEDAYKKLTIPALPTDGGSR